MTLQYWTPFSAQTLEQRHLSTNLNSSHTPAEICSEWLLDLDEQLLMANSNPVSRAIDTCTCPCSCGRWDLAKWPRYELIRKQNIVSIDPRCWVIDENVISLRWWPFWKWCHIGSPSQFGDGGIHFSCWCRSQWQNKIGFIRSWWVHVGSNYWTHGPIHVISVDFKDSHFEFRVNQ